MRRFGVFGVVLTLSCARSAAVRMIRPDVVSARNDDRDRGAHSAEFAVLTFFSRHCPCVRAHEARMAALFERYRDRGVTFLAIDHESDSDAEIDRREAETRRYPFSVVHDRGGGWARYFGAEYATFTVIAGRGGEVLYRGGIDSDRTHLTEAATPYLEDALADVVAARPVRRPEGMTLGCLLRMP